VQESVVFRATPTSATNASWLVMSIGAAHTAVADAATHVEVGVDDVGDVEQE
jgi:hypothetical protein